MGAHVYQYLHDDWMSACVMMMLEAMSQLYIRMDRNMVVRLVGAADKCLGSSLWVHVQPPKLTALAQHG